MKGAMLQKLFEQKFRVFYPFSRFRRELFVCGTLAAGKTQP